MDSDEDGQDFCPYCVRCGELMFRCWNEGIHCFCLIGRYGTALFEP